MTPIRAAAFDLFGTLVELPDPLLRRSLPAVLGVPPRAWLALVRDRLLVEPHGGLAEIAREVVAALTGRDDPALAARCATVMSDHLDRARLVEGVLAALRFLARRGVRLGLVSNLSSAHARILEVLGLSDRFDATVLSFEEGERKPSPRLFAELCRRLGVRPEETVMIGDSAAADVAGARAAGLHALRAGSPELPTASAAGWLRLDASPPRLLLGRGTPLGPEGDTVRRLGPIPDELQGRYNLVWRAELDGAGGAVYVKRFLDPAGAYVEELARRVMCACGLSTPEAWIASGGGEPVLVSRPAPGRPYAGEPDPAVAGELGRHMAFAYAFANADFRPRNAFLERLPGGGARVTMIDLEHCFLDLALDVSDLVDAADPRSLAGIGLAEARSRAARRVLTPRTVRRAVAAFFDPASAAPAVLDAFSGAFLDQYRAMARAADRLTGMIEERILRPPFLVAGTRRYRRALAPLDVLAIAERLAEPAEHVLRTVLGGTP